MKILQLHSWDVTAQEALNIQIELAKQVSRVSQIGEVRLIAGVDMAVGRSGREGRAAVVLLDYPELKAREIQVAEAKVLFPYIPGLLSFREAPIVLGAFAKLTTTPDIVFVDGQGIAHPRRIGIASHIGLFLDLPTIGCAKSILIGHHADLPLEAGSSVPLIDRGEVIGAAVRTKTGVKPVYVSIGHKVDLDSAIKWVLACTRGYRLPEPIRLADRVAGRKDL